MYWLTMKCCWPWGVLLATLICASSAALGNLAADQHQQQRSQTALNSHCNSHYLERIMAESIVPTDVVASKLRIMRTAKARTGGSFNVVCARGHFSYITSTRMYCLVERGGVKCFAFLTEADRHKFNIEQQ